MNTDTLQRALDDLGAAEARTRACERGSAARAAATIDEERASKAVWDAAARGALGKPPPVTPPSPTPRGRTHAPGATSARRERNPGDDT